MAYNAKTKTALYMEVKWSEIDYSRAQNIVNTLAEKTAYVKIRPLKKYYGLVAKKILNKEKLREEKIIAIDINDLKALPSFKNI